MNFLLRCTGLSKSFPGVRALSEVNFDLRPGEVHALAGENGAGKSTLMHILAGVQQPDAGTIELEPTGQVHIPDARSAQELGIAIVYQERSLFHLLSIAENLFVDRQPLNRFGLIDRNLMLEKSRALLAEVDLIADPTMPAGSLSPARQQMLEIAKALSFRSRVFILDEPTAALTAAETATLFHLIRQLRQGGAGIVYISHRLEEIFEIADRVSVLKDGCMQGTWDVADVSREKLVARMVGREGVHGRGERNSATRGKPRLKVKGMQDEKLKNISFEAYGGEILGFAGLAGAGRTELAMAIFGARRTEAGEVFVDDKPARIDSPRDAMDAGIGYLPEDRKEQGIFAGMPIADNIAAARLDAFGGWQIKRGQLFSTASRLMEKLRIAAPSPAKPAGKLSGGNQQKVLLSRWLLRDPGVLIADEPTRGVDVGAKAEIHDILRELADAGKSVIVISSDLPEILAVSDRILVMREGHIVSEMAATDASEERIMKEATS